MNLGDEREPASMASRSRCTILLNSWRLTSYSVSGLCLDKVGDISKSCVFVASPRGGGEIASECFEVQIRQKLEILLTAFSYVCARSYNLQNLFLIYVMSLPKNSSQQQRRRGRVSQGCRYLKSVLKVWLCC